MSAPMRYEIIHEQVAPVRLRRAYADECLPDVQQQAARLEALRYKWGNYQHGWRCLQAFGDWIRRYGLDGVQHLRWRR